jgi:hypothetical protein
MIPIHSFDSIRDILNSKTFWVSLPVNSARLEIVTLCHLQFQECPEYCNGLFPDHGAIDGYSSNQLGQQFEYLIGWSASTERYG